MSETEKKLVNTDFTLYLETEQGNTDDLISGNDDLLRELSDIWTGHENALRLLVRVVNAKVIKKMIETANPVEIVPLRHELSGAENVLFDLFRFHNLYLRRAKPPKPEDNSLQGDTDAPPPKE